MTTQGIKPELKNLMTWAELSQWSRTHTHWPRLVPEWESDGEPCYACRSGITGQSH